MKYYAYLLLAILIAPSLALAESNNSKIAVVDVQQIVRNSLAAKDISAQIEKKRLAYQAEITKQEDELKKKEQELAKQRAVLSPEAFEQKMKEFKGQVAEVQRNVQQRRSELDHAYGNALSQIQKSVQGIISKLSEEKGFDIAIPTSQILFAKKELDISDDVLKRLNTELTKVPLTVEKAPSAKEKK